HKASVAVATMVAIPAARCCSVCGRGTCVSSSAFNDQGHHQGDPFPIGWLPIPPRRLCARLCRPAVLHPVPSAARHQLPTRPAGGVADLPGEGFRSERCRAGPSAERTYEPGGWCTTDGVLAP